MKIKDFLIKNKENLLLVAIVVVLFLFFFHNFFLRGQYINASSFLYLWYPWAKVKPVVLEGVQNYVLSDWVDSLMPALTYLKNASLKLILSGYSFRSNWGGPTGSIIGILYVHEPLILFFTKLFGEQLGSTLLFISKPVLGFIATTLLFKELKLNKYINLISSLAFAFSIPVISYIYGGATTGTVAIAFLFYASVRLGKNFTTKNIILYIVFTIWLITTGFPSSIAYGVLFPFLLFIILIVTNKEFTGKKKLLIISLFIAINLLILGIWAWSILPNLTNLNSFDLKYREEFGSRHLDPSHFLQWIYPNYCGNATTISWICDSNWIESSSSSGIVSLLLFFLGLPSILSKKKNKKISLSLFIMTCLSFFIIFNIGGITKILANLPLFSILPSTRLVFLLPLLVTITAGISFDIVLKDIKEKKSKQKIILFWLLEVAVLSVIVFVNFEGLLNHLRLLDRASFLQDAKEFITIFVAAIAILFLILFCKNKTLKKVLFIILSVLTVLDLYFYNSNIIPYQKKEEIFPVTKGIEFLQDNMNKQDRILPIERVFLPNTNYYYGINSLIGHDWRTAAFNEAMQPIEEGIFNNVGTMQFFSREKILTSSEELKNYLRFNRVKYIVQKPASLTLENDALFLQPYINEYIPIDNPIVYVITVNQQETLEYIELEGQCYEDRMEVLSAEDIRIRILSPSGTQSEVPVLEISSSCSEEGILKILTPKMDLEKDWKLSLEILNSKNWEVGVWSGKDIREDTVLEGREEIFELVGRIYSRVREKPIYTTVYNDDLLIHEVSEETSVAYFFPCGDLRKEACTTKLKGFHIKDPRDLKEFNNFFANFREVPFKDYAEGKIILDTSQIHEPGVIIFSDNYFEGWNTKEGEVFQGFLKSLNVYSENPDDTIILTYTNEFLPKGIIISLLSISILSILLFALKRRIKL